MVVLARTTHDVFMDLDRVYLVLVDGYVATAYSTREKAREAIRGVAGQTLASLAILKFCVATAGKTVYVWQRNTTEAPTPTPPLVESDARELAKKLRVFSPRSRARDCGRSLDSDDTTLGDYLADNDLLSRE